MQTFLPYGNFAKSAATLDNTRLGNQRNECKVIIDALEGRSKAWRNHPAVKMWEGYVPALKAYYNAVICEYVRRGNSNSMALFYDIPYFYSLPPWFGGKIHAHHRARLLAKAPEFYSKYGWTETPTEANYYPGFGYYKNGKK